MIRSKKKGIVVLVATTALLGVSGAIGDELEISWFTIDGGGGMFSTGDAYELGGTIGQPDASSPGTPMSGGKFDLVGGFWLVAGDVGCVEPILFGDVAPLFGVIDFDDILCILDGFADIAACPQGDIVGAGVACPPFEANGIDFDDVLAVLDTFGGNPPCPDPCPPPGP